MLRLLIALTLNLIFGPSSTPIHHVIPNSPSDMNATLDKHFDRVLIIVLENQSYVSAIKDKYLKQLAEEGVDFTDFRAVGHPSYPNYLAMISGSSFGIHGLLGDSQRNFPDDSEHKTIGDLLDWKNYAENYPTKPVPYLGDGGGTDAPKYARKHVPFLSFQFKRYRNRALKTLSRSIPTTSTMRLSPMWRTQERAGRIVVTSLLRRICFIRQTWMTTGTIRTWALRPLGLRTLLTIGSLLTPAAEH